MKLRIEGNFKDFRVVNAETGEELQGVKSVKWDAGFFNTCTLELTNAAIDVSIDASRVEAVMFEDGKYAHTKLLDIAGLRWLRRDRS